MEQNRYEPIKHTTLSRAGHALGEGAQKGFWGGLKGVAWGFLAIPLLIGVGTMGVGVLAGSAVTGILTAGAVATVASTLLLAPINAIMGVGGATVGTAIAAYRGAKQGGERTGKEHMAARYVDGYEAQMASMQNELMSAMERAQLAEQRPIMMPQPAPAPAPVVAEAPKAVVHEHPHTKDHGKTHDHPKTHHDVPTTKIAAGAHNGLQHDNRIADHALAAGAAR